MLSLWTAFKRHVVPDNNLKKQTMVRGPFVVRVSMATTESDGNSTNSRPRLKSTIKQKKANIRRIEEEDGQYTVVIMSEKDLDGYPEPHHLTLDKSDMTILRKRLDCDTVQELKEMVPDDNNSEPCPQDGPQIWIAHTLTGSFGWQLSAVAKHE